MKGWKNGRMEGWKDGRMEGWKDERMKGQLIIYISRSSLWTADYLII